MSDEKTEDRRLAYLQAGVTKLIHPFKQTILLRKSFDRRRTILSETKTPKIDFPSCCPIEGISDWLALATKDPLTHKPITILQSMIQLSKVDEL